MAAAGLETEAAGDAVLGGRHESKSSTRVVASPIVHRRRATNDYRLDGATDLALRLDSYKTTLAWRDTALIDVHSWAARATDAFGSDLRDGHPHPTPDRARRRFGPGSSTKV